MSLFYLTQTLSLCLLQPLNAPHQPFQNSFISDKRTQSRNCNTNIERANVHCQDNVISGSFNVGLTSLVNQKLDCFKLTEDNNFY